MVASPFFIRIKADVLKVVSTIPSGKLCTYRAIGEHLDVMPRHVAYILSTLEGSEKLFYPWHRVVGEGGKLGVTKRMPSGETQAQMLILEGVFTNANAVDPDMLRHFMTVTALASGVAKQTRPKDAPAVKIRNMKAGTN